MRCCFHLGLFLLCNACAFGPGVDASSGEPDASASDRRLNGGCGPDAVRLPASCEDSEGPTVCIPFPEDGSPARTPCFSDVLGECGNAREPDTYCTVWLGEAAICATRYGSSLTDYDGCISVACAQADCEFGQVCRENTCEDPCRSYLDCTPEFSPERGCRASPELMDSGICSVLTSCHQAVDPRLYCYLLAFELDRVDPMGPRLSISCVEGRKQERGCLFE